MKKKVTAIIFAFFSFVSADEPSIDRITSKLTFDTKTTLSSTSNQLKNSVFYVRFVAADPSVLTQYQVSPGFGLGYRQSMGSNAFDVFGSLSGREGRRTYTWTFPKASYIHYLSPNSDQSMYVGAGMGFGGIHSMKMKIHDGRTKKDHDDFIGLMAHATVGMELCRRQACVVLTELSLSQPIIPANNRKGIPGPSAEVSLGLGF